MKQELPKKIYQTLVEHMNEAVWVGDKNEKTVYVNPKYCKLTGYTFEEVLAKDSFDFWDKETTRKIKSVNAKDRTKGISSSYEGNLLNKQGEKIPVLVSGTPLENGGTSSIITDLRSIKKKESRYRKLVEHMNEAVWMGDENEVTLYANPKFCELMGYSLEEMIGKKSYDFWDKESVEMVKKNNKNQRKRGLSSSYEGNLLTKKGEKIPVLLSGTPLEEGGTIGIMTDLRALREKEEAERVLGNAVQNANDAIIIFDNKSKIVSWNKGAKLLFGYRQDEILDHQLEQIFPHENLSLVLKNTKKLQNLELEALHKNKKSINISVTLTPIYEKNKNKIYSYLMIGRDIVEQTQFANEITLKYQKIKEAYNQLGIMRRQSEYLLDLIKLCNETNDLTKIADFIVTSVIMLTRGDACVLRIYNPKKETLSLISSFGIDQDWRGKAVINLKNSLVEKAFNQNMPLRILDVAREYKHQSIYLVKKNNLASLLLIPLVHKSKLVGSLSLYTISEKKLEIFENSFIEKYSELISLIIGKEF